MTHALKTWPNFFSALNNGEKLFELRKDDRPFEIGDTLILQEYNDKEKHYTGKELNFTISYILRDGMVAGLKSGYCILGIKEKE